MRYHKEHLQNRQALRDAIESTITDEFVLFNIFHNEVSDKLQYITRFRNRGVEYIDLFEELEQVSKSRPIEYKPIEKANRCRITDRLIRWAPKNTLVTQ